MINDRLSQARTSVHDFQSTKLRPWNAYNLLYIICMHVQPASYIVGKNDISTRFITSGLDVLTL
ncbi:uncharacterized protein METZ01_LOCUS88530 [marine metagenome]|uniref:Uncharacterized protein n=1 Tax=marine metagenome TaxID=408172 RepID=A0A381V5L7_9ZZZZ